MQVASQNISDSLGCADVKSKLFDAFYLLLDQEKVLPSSTSLKFSISERVDQLVAKNKNIFLSESKMNPLIWQVSPAPRAVFNKS